MKFFKQFLMGSLVGLSAFGANVATAHDPESRVEIEAGDEKVFAAGSIDLGFQLIDLKLKKLVVESDLAVVHEKFLHMYIYDEALKELIHIHPESDKDTWKIQFNIARNGNYFLWVQGQLAADGEEFSSFMKFQITGGTEAFPMPPVLGNHRSGSDGLSQVSMSNEKFKAKKMVMPTLNISRSDGSAPELTPWLGAPAHVLIVSSDGDSLVHAHPVDHGTPNSLMLHTQFPKAGDYRVWVQFVDQNILRTVSLSVRVY